MVHTSKHRFVYRGLIALAALALPLGVAAAQAAPASAQATAAKTKPKGTEISVANTAFGRALVVGSGPFKGFSLYFLSWDKPPVYGCTTGATKTPVGPITCTGPSNDHNAEWPAITTNGKPIAGPGVSAKLLGTVKRKGVGTQITYAGYPLYLFDQMPAQVTGEGWFEPGLPPWFGIWWLMSPSGYPLPWVGSLGTTVTLGGKTVLAAYQLTGAGWEKFPLYTFSADTSSYAACSAIRACARAWPPMLTSGGAGWTGLSGSQIGTVGNPGGLKQVTWAGQPLYLFSHEQIALGPGGVFAPVGNGNGIKAFGGTFSLVVNP